MMCRSILRIVFSVCAFLLVAVGSPSARVQSLESPISAIEGIVVSAGSDAPLDRAQVTLIHVMSSAATCGANCIVPGDPSTPVSMVTTESDGKFSFQSVKPGQYRVRAVRNGYAVQEYGQPAVFGIGAVIIVTSGQVKKDVTFRLIPDGAVSGRVMDSNANPIAGMQVSLMRQVYSLTGQLGRASEGSAVTDDRGEYRIYWVPPGNYMVRVEDGPAKTAASNISVAPDFPATYYPSAVDASLATSIQIEPAREFPGINIVLTKLETFRIRGKVVDSGTGRPPASFAVSLSQRIEAGSPFAWTLSAPKYKTTTDAATGAFEIRGVIPGSYWLRASTLVCGDCLLDLPDNEDDLLKYLTDLANGRTDSPRISSLRLPPESPPSAQIPIDVNKSDIENVALTLLPNVAVLVHISMNGPDITPVAGADQMRVALFPTASGAGIIDGTLYRSRGFSAVYGVPAGEYRLSLRWTLSAQPDFFVKEAYFGAKNALDDSFVVTTSSNETLNIVLSDKGSQLDGTLTDSLSNRRSNVPVVLIPDMERNRPELYKNAITDKDGHFSFRGIAPGAYRIFAWEALESFSYWNSEVLSRYESQGKAIEMHEGSKQTVEVKIIPARQ